MGERRREGGRRDSAPVPTPLLSPLTQGGSSGKSSHGVKYVDARTRSDARGEKLAEKKKKKAGKGSTNGKAGSARGGVEKKKGNRQKKGTKYSRK